MTHPTSGPALGVLELSSIARGIVACDALAKRAPVSIAFAGPVTPGKYVVVFHGGVAEVAESMAAAREASAGTELDALELPAPHDAIVPALSGLVPEPPSGALGVLELSTVAATLRALDAALKAAAVELVTLHLARGIGGKGYFVVTGDLSDVEAAVEAGDRAVAPEHRAGREIVARPHADVMPTVRSPLIP